METYKLEERIGCFFENKHLLHTALTHKSSKKPYNNERLEFLGDAVVDLIVGEFLFNEFGDSQEGDLSKMRASIVSESGLTKLANAINLGEFLSISLSEEQNSGRSKPSILSNAFEALVGAIYIECGLEFVSKFVLSLVESEYADISPQSLFLDYKTALQEVTQANFGSVPEYRVLSQSGPDHKKSFEVGIYINGKEYAREIGANKKSAQQKCAKIAYEILTKK